METLGILIGASVTLACALWCLTEIKPGLPPVGWGEEIDGTFEYVGVQDPVDRALLSRMEGAIVLSMILPSCYSIQPPEGYRYRVEAGVLVREKPNGV
jgi:hypothetical protein